LALVIPMTATGQALYCVELSSIAPFPSPPKTFLPEHRIEPPVVKMHVTSSPVANAAATAGGNALELEVPPTVVAPPVCDVLPELVPPAVVMAPPVLRTTPVFPEPPAVCALFCEPAPPEQALHTQPAASNPNINGKRIPKPPINKPW
jgi:hypothetical protein